MAKKNFGGVYANMEFPEYTYREYPKALSVGPHGQTTIVNSAVEEQEILAKLQKDEDDAPAQQAPHVADPAKEILISRARELGVPFNSKWSKAKLQMTVESAEADVDNLPAEMTEVKKHKVIEATLISDLTTTESQEEYKDHLIERAKSLGIPANKLWGIPRLKASITEAEAKIKE